MDWIVNGWYYDDNNEFNRLPDDGAIMSNEELIAFLGSIRYNEHYITQRPYYQLQMTTETNLIVNEVV